MEFFMVFVAFGAGLLSFFSPCILPVVPAYICFITGLSLEELTESKKGLNPILPNALLFILGFSAVFVILGASATFLGSFLFAKQRVIKLIAGIIVIFFGLHISGVFNIKFLQAEKKLHLKKKPLSFLGSFLVGIAFGFGWTPCVGPILGSILILAAAKETVLQGIMLLSFYSLGLAIPFFMVAVGIGWALRLFSKIKRYFRLISAISGILLIAIGIWVILG